jgi:hypothetical protein
MGRTIPSFRMALELEKEDWKPFRNALDKSDRKKFDEMWDIPRLYTSACSYAANPVRLYPILMSILLYHYKQLSQCISEAEEIEARLFKSKSKEGEDRELLQARQQQPTPPSKQRQTQKTQLQTRRQTQLKLSEF